MNFAMKSRAVLTALMLTASGATATLAADAITVPNAAAVPAAEVPAEAIVVNINKMKYDQPELKVKPGDTVYWINKEVMPHNVAFKKGEVGDEPFKGDMLKKDQAYSITFNEAGAYEYHCTPHPFMRAKVIVE
ncbi:amicyanin [Paracoccus simplex]|uniref:Amicyanin n=1 Tax=Paracoccus simplex TaxID=2086346 RepID=A0ABV7RXW6_9RHOB